VGGDWTLRSLIVRHKRFSFSLLAVILVMLAAFVATLVGPSAGAVSDSTSCSEWGSANQSQQHAYGALYVKEHGSLRDGATSPTSVVASVNTGCGQAFDNDVSDDINVYQAINSQY
jgi:FlaG/FlaF family flagellin (archaellin)